MKTRFEFIDATRALFAVQGVFFHALLPYREDRASAIKSPESLDGVSALVTWLHSFRMQGFFLISGILCWQLLQRQGTTEYVRSRAKRLALPCISVFVTVNLIERAMHQRFNPDLAGGKAELSVGHLWFMGYLLMFTLALPVLSEAVRKTPVRLFTSRCDAATIERLLPALLGIVGILTVVSARSDWWYASHLGFLQPVSFLLGASYFFIGAFVASENRIDILAQRPSAAYWAGATVGWFGIGAIVDTMTAGSHSASVILEHIYGIFVLRILFWGASQAARRIPRSPLTSTVDATMTIYLLHHCIVVSGALLFLGVHWHPGVEILLLLFLGLSIPYVVHQRVIRRFPLASLLFNGAERARLTPQVVPALPQVQGVRLTFRTKTRATSRL